MKMYSYVGPKRLWEEAQHSPPGSIVRSADDLLLWLRDHSADVNPDGSIPATFVVDAEGRFRLASRYSEHVACAGRGQVLSAGEMAFSADGAMVSVSNQSTGYCPEPESWVTVANVLDEAGIGHDNCFTSEIVFRLCTGCGERNIVKDNFFRCDLCDEELPAKWNFDR